MILKMTFPLLLQFITKSLMIIIVEIIDFYRKTAKKYLFS